MRKSRVGNLPTKTTPKGRRQRRNRHQALNASLDQALQALKEARVTILPDLSRYLNDD